jgi:hypothetical protein
LSSAQGHNIPGPFGQLVRLFLNRTFHGGDESGGGELDLSIGLVLSLLALPGALYSMLLFEKYSTLLLWMRGQHNFDPVAATVPDEYFFIVLSMVVTGVVAVWSWDSLFPDRRDYMNLVPLPISIRVIFLANLTAILCLAAVLALDVNAASALIYPLAASSGQESFRYVFQLAGTHILAVLLASAFSFFVILAAIGLLMAALPSVVFRRLSIYVRGAILVLLVGLLSTSFAVPSVVGRLPLTWIRFLPSVWFLGLAQLVHGSAIPALSALGWVAVKIIAIVIATAMAAYAVSYRAYFARIPEAAEVTSSSRYRGATWIFRVLDRTWLRTPFQRAGYRFVLATLLRNERHSLVLAGFVALAIVVSSQVVFGALAGGIRAGGVPSAEILSVPSIFAYCIVLGLRVTFEAPADWQANWIFRLTIPASSTECTALARKVMISFVVPWVVVFVIPIYGFVWGWGTAGLHALVVVISSVVLIRALLVGYRKVPFTCSYPPFRNSAIVMVLGYVAGFFVFVVLISSLESQILANPLYAIPLVLLWVAVWLLASLVSDGIAEVDKQVIFEDRPVVGFELLDLERRS